MIDTDISTPGTYNSSEYFEGSDSSEFISIFEKLSQIEDDLISGGKGLNKF